MKTPLPFVILGYIHLIEAVVMYLLIFGMVHKGYYYVIPLLIFGTVVCLGFSLVCFMIAEIKRRHQAKNPGSRP